MEIGLQEWIFWIVRLEITPTGMNRETAADPILPISMTALDCPIPILYSTPRHFIIFALHIRLRHHPIQIKPQLEIRIPIQSTSLESGRWLTWPARRAKTNPQICLRTLAIRIIRPARFCRRWPLEVFIHFTILTCDLNCTETSTVPRT